MTTLGLMTVKMKKRAAKMVIKRKDSPIHALESLTMVTFANNCKGLAVLAVDIDDEDDDECVYVISSFLYPHIPSEANQWQYFRANFQDRCGRESRYDAGILICSFNKTKPSH